MFVFQYYGTSQSSFSATNAQKKFGFEKYLCQNFGTSHLFKGNQVFKFETEYKINVYFLIFIALPKVHCTRQKSLLGRHRPSKWLQMAKIPFCGHEPVLWIQTGGTRLEQVKAHPGNVMEPFLWSRMLIGGPNYPKNVPKRAQRGHN